MELVTEIVRLGIVGIVLVLMGVMLFIGVKFFLPLVIAARPPNGKADSAGPLFLVLQQIGTLPGEIKALNATISVLMQNVFTKAETMDEFRKNRHDIADALTAPILRVGLELKKGLLEIRKAEERRLRNDRRGRSRTSSDRRRK